MPPISVTAWESDGDGGWLVAWHDDANAEGQPVDAYIHLSPESVADLELARGLVEAPPTEMVRAIETLYRDREATQRGRPPTIPEGVTPFAIRDFIDGYEVHLKDCIDRIRLDVIGHAPHAVLEAVRNGEPVPEQYRREPRRQLIDFIGRHGPST